MLSYDLLNVELTQLFGQLLLVYLICLYMITIFMGGGGGGRGGRWGGGSSER